MKAKQVLAKVFASAMVFSTLFGTSVMADEIDGDTIYIDKEIIDVTLPTTASQKFYIDPQGLIAVGKDTNSGKPKDEGLVVGVSDMYAINRSSIPLVLSVSYELKDTGDAVVVDTVGDPEEDVKKLATKAIAVSVSAVQSDQDETEVASAYGGKVFKSTGSAQDISQGTGLDTADDVYAKKTTPATADYFMTAATYKFELKEGKTAADAYDSSAYQYVIDETAKDASCLKLTIGGYCSTKADWSAYVNGTATIKLDVIFKFKKVDSTKGDYTDAEVGNDEVTVGPKVTIAADGVITLSGLTPDNTINSVADIQVIWPEGSYTLVKGTNSYTMDASQYIENSGTITITLPASKWSGTIDNKSVKVKVTLTGGSTIESNSVTISYT